MEVAEIRVWCNLSNVLISFHFFEAFRMNQKRMDLNIPFSYSFQYTFRPNRPSSCSQCGFKLPALLSYSITKETNTRAT
jgi:hypothetical protein